MSGPTRKPVAAGPGGAGAAAAPSRQTAGTARRPPARPPRRSRSRRVIPSVLMGSSCVDPCECAIIYGMRIVERTILAVLLAATLATLLLVARNGLAPVQHPVSFGLVLWAWVLLFYSAVGAGALLLAGLASKLPGLRSLPRWLLFGATAVFTAVALVSNPRAVSSVFTLSGPGLSALLLPVSVVLCALALPAVGAPLDRGAAWVRAGALIGVASGLGALAPHGERPGTAVRTSASARVQGHRFVLVGVDGAD